ncbi:MAG: prefoldin subunit alpha [Thermoplasmata archaeon]|nr:prefoldin subunit alpha [Thermoplasmata archaeon]
MSPEEQVQEDLMRLEAYRSQLSASLQQHQMLTGSRAEHDRARESLEGVDQAPPDAELILPLGGETFVRGAVDRSAPVLIGVGSGVVVEMERPKVVELLAQRLVKIDDAIRELEGQMNTLDERIQLLSQRLESATRNPSSGDVGGD